MHEVNKFERDNELKIAMSSEDLWRYPSYLEKE